MYQQHFGLTSKPFNLVPDPSFLYLSPNHRKALTMLEYGLMSQAGFTVVTGEIGAGKTTLIRTLLTKLGNDCVIGLINNTHESFGDLMTWVLDALEIESSATDNAGRYRDYIDFVIEQHANNKRVILIVDEAQNLSVKALEELRLLSNVNIDKDIFLQIILTGQPELIDKLNMPQLEQFAQRIGVEFHLSGLNYIETKRYIEYRLKIAGSVNYHEIFTEQASAIIYCYSEGIPRKINNLCDFSMVFAFAEGEHTVTADIVFEMMKEKRSSRVIKTKEHNNPDVKRIKKWLLETHNITLI